MLDVSLAPVQRYEHLFVFPLVVPQPVELPYRLLSEALAAGSLEITEKGAGSVSTLIAMNRGREDVLVLDGEQLIGAKQNRTTNRSLILLAGSTTEIPVSCMEHGRWDAGHTPFTSGLHNSPSEVRRHAREVEARHLAAGQAPSPSSLSQAQGAVWGTIQEAMGALGTHSGTGALNEAYTARSADIDQWLAAFSPVERQVGILAFHGRRPLGLDLLGGCTSSKSAASASSTGTCWTPCDRRMSGRPPPPSRRSASSSRSVTQSATPRPRWERGATR